MHGNRALVYFALVSPLFTARIAAAAPNDLDAAFTALKGSVSTRVPKSFKGSSTLAAKAWTDPLQTGDPMSVPSVLEVSGIRYKASLASSVMDIDDKWPGPERDSPGWDAALRAHMIPGQPAPTWDVMVEGADGSATHDSGLVGLQLYEYRSGAPELLRIDREALRNVPRGAFYAGVTQYRISLPAGTTLDLAKTYVGVVTMVVDGRRVQIKTRKMYLAFRANAPWGNEGVARATP